ncbi:MAG: indolepyruvate ferredoxin oxidoreductase subunit alpha [Spirochaetota bacterium]|nr:indolepyruvate ferredoxin oxidoreductase subunit alpha [Spirochaetota bacterium]
MNRISERSGGKKILLQGNEAIARGALEGGAIFFTGYPGNPSSEIIETLAEASKDLPVYVEWSSNEKVALEAATAASFAGCRAMVCMKQNGVNVASDFLTNLTMSGTKGGLVLVTCDDPGGISSTNEEDARLFAKLADIPLLEPSTPMEALEMARWSFELSETIGNVVILRSISRVSHTRSTVETKEIPQQAPNPAFDLTSPFHTFPVVEKHKAKLAKLDIAAGLFEDSPFNVYEGPSNPELLVISSGCSWRYVTEAVPDLELSDKVGILKLGTTWPLPKELIKKHLETSNKVLFVEDVNPFIEDNIKSYGADLGKEIGLKEYFGKGSGTFPMYGEHTPSTILTALGSIFEIDWQNEYFRDQVEPVVSELVPSREFGFCPGCPHRATYYAIKTALAWDNNDGFVSGDIGCYTMGIWPTGFSQVKSVHAMGSGAGISCGYGKLDRFGFDQPVITLCGDSTFFHSAIPALINSKFNQSELFLLILDNSATAMTGFQPHPGTDRTAMGIKTEPVDIEALCHSMMIDVKVTDPYDMYNSSVTIYNMMKQKGPRVLIMRRKCALVQGREGGFPYKMRIDQESCLGEDCGCSRYCTRIFRCPGLIWDDNTQTAMIDDVICVGCGICSDICPQQAIIKEEIHAH